MVPCEEGEEISSLLCVLAAGYVWVFLYLSWLLSLLGGVAFMSWPSLALLINSVRSIVLG